MTTTPLVDDARLAEWMDEQDLARGAPLSVTRITTGHSNEVFLVERGELVAVLAVSLITNYQYSEKREWSPARAVAA